MNVRQRRKLFAGAGLISMLFGAVMVVAPTGAGADEVPVTPTPQIFNSNVHCGAPTGKVAGLGYSNGIKFDGSAAAGQAGSGGVSYTRTEGTPLTFDWTSTNHPIDAVIVKQANGAAVFTYPQPGATSGQVYVATGNTSGISHIDFCYDSEDPDPSGTLIVRKDVVPDPDGDPTFGFGIDGPDDFDYDDSLGDGDFNESDVPAGEYTITETSAAGYELEGVACTVGRDSFTPTLNGTSVTVSVPDGATVDCTFTNVPVSDEPDTSLILRKQVTGVGTWSIDLTCTAEVPQRDEQVLTAAVVGGTQRVNNGAPQFTCADQPGTYVIEEDLTDETPNTMTFVGVACSKPSGEAGTVPVTATPVPDQSGKWTVAVEEGASVTCTFTNQVPGDNPPPRTPPPTPTPQAALTIEKEWRAAPADWAVDFIGTLGSFELTDEIDDRSFTGLTPGTFVIREAPSSDYDLAAVDCDGGTVEELGNGVRITVADGADVTCTFTNVEVEVLPAPPVENPPVVTPPVETPPQATPQAQPATQVRGAVVTRQLPRTGSESTDLAAFGAGLLLLGAGLVVTSRVRFARVD